MEKKDIILLAMEYGNVKWKLGYITLLKLKEECTEDLSKEYDELNKRRFELLDELYDADRKN